MVDKDGVTCTSCLTLNPPDAPACVRCNMPLPRPSASPPPPQQPTQHSTQRPVRQGPRAPERPNVPMTATTPPPSPPRRRRRTSAQSRRRRLVIIGNLVVLLLFAGGAIAIWQLRPHYLNTDEVAQQIADEIGASVDCPSEVKREAGETFTCTATYPNDREQTIEVRVRNDDGRYEWQPVRK